MANSRIARFFMEVAPPQYVTVMRHRTSKMLDTITEDEREISTSDSVMSPPKKSKSAVAVAASSASASVTNVKGRCFLKESLPIFYDNLASGTVASTPDPASAILMGVEVLVTVSRKDVLFPMDVWHVGHLLHIPAAFFQNFHQLRATKASGPSEALMISEEHICDPAKRVDFCPDHQFLVSLFEMCCKLLYTTILHRPRCRCEYINCRPGCSANTSTSTAT
ncbi:hypothetical protein D0Y65_012283 [Glycine soja]|uniref:Uncharacterized protein n=1 Tax=Glycine soja TaxID=3848 RepID=A0A445KP11_GLYSO|nr:hypothetical protein D0Y65_012283 [Glycine soja]